MDPDPTVRVARRLRRSLLITPGNHRARIAKAATLPADGIVLDLEDGVAPEHKPAARQIIVETLSRLPWGRRERIVRVNAAGTTDYDADLAVLDVADIDALFVPKIEQPGALDALAKWLDGAERRRPARSRPVEIIATVETPRGLFNALAIAEATPRTTALFFGSGDYTAATGSAVTERALAVPRALIVAAAAACRIDAIDAAYFTAVKDQAATRADAAVARELGFTGKLVFHPDQIAVANEVFSPAEPDVERARRIVAAYEAALREGRGTAYVDGEFIAVDIAIMARNVLARAEQVRRAGQ